MKKYFVATAVALLLGGTFLLANNQNKTTIDCCDQQMECCISQDECCETQEECCETQNECCETQMECCK